jgi:hypothetical protein
LKQNLLHFFIFQNLDIFILLEKLIFIIGEIIDIKKGQFNGNNHHRHKNFHYHCILNNFNSEFNSNKIKGLLIKEINFNYSFFRGTYYWVATIIINFDFPPRFDFNFLQSP